MKVRKESKKTEKQSIPSRIIHVFTHMLIRQVFMFCNKIKKEKISCVHLEDLNLVFQKETFCTKI